MAIRCKICNKRRHHLTPHLRSHNLTSDERAIHRDSKVDNWCFENGWLFLWLTDLDIYNKPNMCRNMIQRLVKGTLIPYVGRLAA